MSIPNFHRVRCKAEPTADERVVMSLEVDRATACFIVGLLTEPVLDGIPMPPDIAPTVDLFKKQILNAVAGKHSDGDGNPTDEPVVVS